MWWVTDFLLFLILLTLMRRNMKTDELVTALDGINTGLGALTTQMTKVVAEETTLGTKIADLTAQLANQDLPQTVTDAVAAVQTQFNTLKATVQAADDLVPDQVPVI